MADFKDRLWRDLVREHGADLARIDRAVPPRPRRRVVAAGAAGLVAAGTALLVALGTSGTPPAFAVQRHADGTVTVTINRIEGIRGANARLAALGVNVRAVPFDAGCGQVRVVTAGQAPPALRRALQFARARRGAIVSVRIAPWRLDRGKVAVLAARPGEVKASALVTELAHRPVPQCVGPIETVPPPAGPVVCHTVDGTTRPFPPEEAPPAAVGNSGDSGASGAGNSGAGPGVPHGRRIVCQTRVTPPGPSGHSGDSGDSGVTGDR
jgi:hypothetical protein